MVRNYLSEGGELETSTAGPATAHGVTSKTLTRLKRVENRPLIMKTQEMAQKILEKYDRCGVPACGHRTALDTEAVPRLQAKSLFMRRVANFLANEKLAPSADIVEFAEVAEAKLRKTLSLQIPGMDLGEPVFQGATKAEREVAKKEKASVTPKKQSDQSILSAPLVFSSSGDVVQTVALQAEEMNIVPGAAVKVQGRPCADGDGDEGGFVQGFSNTKVLVRLDSGHEIRCILQQLVLNEEPPRKKAKNTDGEMTSTLRFKELEWNPPLASERAPYTRELLRAALWQLAEADAQTCDPCVLGIERALSEDGKSARWRVTTKTSFPAYGLRIAPYTHVVLPQNSVTKQADVSAMVPRSCADLVVSLRDNPSETFKACVPPKLLKKDDPDTIHPFWVIPDASTDGQGNVSVVFAHLLHEKPSCSAAIGRGLQHAIAAAARGKMKMTLPVITNQRALGKGVELHLGSVVCAKPRSQAVAPKAVATPAAVATEVATPAEEATEVATPAEEATEVATPAEEDAEVVQKRVSFCLNVSE